VFVNEFLRFYISFLHLKSNFRNSSLSYWQLSWSRITDKFVINAKLRSSSTFVRFTSNILLEYGRWYLFVKLNQTILYKFNMNNYRGKHYLQKQNECLIVKSIWHSLSHERGVSRGCSASFISSLVSFLS